MRTVSSKPRKQRKAQTNTPFNRKIKEIKAPLDPKKFKTAKVRRVVIRSGDTVKVVRGGRTGHEGKVASVDLKKGKVSVEKALIRKADNKEVPLWFEPSKLVITKLDMSDPVRKEKFKDLSEE